MQARVAVGVALLYSALLAAFTIFGISKAAIVGGFLVLTVFAYGLSLRYGPPVAIMGLVFGDTLPALLGVDSPNTPVLFGYLFAVAAGTMILVRHRRWWGLGIAVLLAAVVWVIAWIVLDSEGWIWPALFLAASCALFAWATRLRFQ